MYLFFIALLSFINRMNAKCLCSEGSIDDYFDDLSYVGDSEFYGEIDFNATVKNLAKSIEYLTAQGKLIFQKTYIMRKIIFLFNLILRY